MPSSPCPAASERWRSCSKSGPGASSAITTSRSACSTSAGYYDALLDFLQGTRREGFVNAEQLALLQVAADAPPLLDCLATLAAGATAPDDYESI